MKPKAEYVNGRWIIKLGGFIVLRFNTLDAARDCLDQIENRNRGRSNGVFLVENGTRR